MDRGATNNLTLLQLMVTPPPPVPLKIKNLLSLRSCGPLNKKPVNPSLTCPLWVPYPLPSSFPALRHKTQPVATTLTHHPPTHTMFHSSSSPSSSSSSSSPYINDPAHALYCTSMGPPPITNTLTLPYTLYDSTITTTNNTLSSSSPPFSSSLPSVNSYLMHRSSSTHSFTYPHHQVAACCVPDPTLNPSFFSSSSSLSSPPSSASCDHLLDFHSQTPVRRVFSTGDLQGMNCMQMQGLAATASTENCGQEGGKVGRYSAEERMKRIERYRSKRNHRNFHKKITYACRKTLADSRPRVRGRFARNGETETEAEAEAEPSASEITYESYNHYNHENCGIYNGYNNGDNGGNYNNELWRQIHMQAALATTDEEEECCYDEELWANIESVFSMNLLS